MTNRPILPANSYWNRYTNLVDDGNILEKLTTVNHQTQEFLATIPDEKGNYRYQEGKWTIKEVLIHIIDTERIMAYRALRFARKDKTPLPGFSENDFVAALDVTHRSIADLVQELAIVRAATLSLFKNFTTEQWMERGIASKQEVSVLALAYIIVGHEIHHLKVIKERYLG